MKLTILEGPDGSGKTTTADQIVDGWEAMKIHQGPFQSNPLLETMVKIDTAVELAEQFGAVHLVMDRSHIGELIYGPLFRGHSKMELDTAQVLNAYIRSKHDTRIILCHPPLETVVANWVATEKSQMYETEYAEIVWLAYKALAEVAPLMFDATFDYTEDNWKDVI